jgi:hypothetical protein
VDLKPDGRMYCRTTRRCVAIISEIEQGREYSLNEITAMIEAKALPEFFLERFGKQMSSQSIHDYVSYLVELEVLSPSRSGYILAFEHRQTDEDWAQALSDRALLHLARIVDKAPKQTIEYLQQLQNELLDERRLTRIESLITAAKVTDTRTRMLFRWSLYVFTDVDKCPFDIRRYPVVVNRGE